MRLTPNAATNSLFRGYPVSRLQLALGDLGQDLLLDPDIMARLAGGQFDRFRHDNLAMPLSRMIAPRAATMPRK